MRPVVLLGMRGVGKTTVGRRLAELLGVEFADSDELLAEAQGKAHAGDVLVEVGEPEFRALELAALERALETAGVVSSGGGCVEHPDSMKLLRERARCVLLDASVRVLQERIAGDPSPRPPLVPGAGGAGDALAELEVLWSRRHEGYRVLAEFSFSTEGLDPDQVARGIADRLRRNAPA